MGFLDNSTNNIIVDAVLTDLGRQALANGTFDITQFSLGDDEVDYTIIQKFGRTVGKEKIIKNTPIYEAQTTATLALKHRLLTLADPTVIYLPTITVTGDVSGNTVTLSTTNSSASVTIVQDIQGVTSPATKIPIDDVFYVEVPNRFLRLLDASSFSIGITDSRIEKGTQTALYTVSRTTTTKSKGLPILTLNIATQGLDDTVFNTFGTTASKNRIDCVFSVIGRSTGLRSTINVIINK